MKTIPNILSRCNKTSETHSYIWCKLRSGVSFLQVASVHVWATWQLGDPSPEGGGPASPSHCENMWLMEEFLNSARWSLRTKEERDRQPRKRGHPWGADVFNPILAQLSLFPVNCWRKWKLGVQFLVIHHHFCCQSKIKYHVIRAECRNMLWILEFERKINVNKRVCLLWRPGTRKDQNC